MTLGIGNSRGADLYRDQHHLRYRNPPGHQRSLVGIARDLRRAGTFLLSRKPGFCDCQRGTPNWRIAARYHRPQHPPDGGDRQRESDQHAT